jgi:hypothetical protein
VQQLRAVEKIEIKNKGEEERGRRDGGGRKGEREGMEENERRREGRKGEISRKRRERRNKEIVVGKKPCIVIFFIAK